MRALIVSDGRVGHEIQSEGFCKLKNLSSSTLKVSYTSKYLKLLSYFFDWLSIYIKIFQSEKIKGDFSLIVATGSTTYYPALYFAKKLNLPVISLMYPKGYNLTHFTYILASFHDHPSDAKNIIKTPANISFTTPNGLFLPSEKSIGIILGGSNKVYDMDKNEIKSVLEKIKEDFANYEIAITTSPRTPKSIEKMVKEFGFSYEVIFSENKINPIGDFLSSCETVFITEDSTSMISQAVSFGSADISIIKLQTKNENNKYRDFTNNLVKKDYAYFYEQRPKKTKKLDFSKILEEVVL